MTVAVSSDAKVGSAFREGTPVWMQWSLVFLVGMLLFTNHYVRDSLGALQKQLETDIPGFTPHVYSSLNTFYFIPNVITPILAGFLIKPLGIRGSYLLSVVISATGHILFAIAVSWNSLPLMYFSKFLAGTMYEIIDAYLPILYLGAIFRDDFVTVIGAVNALLRCGSVVNFIVTPLVYNATNIETAIWSAHLIGASAIPIFYFCILIERKYVISEEEEEEVVSSPPLPPALDVKNSELDELDTDTVPLHTGPSSSASSSTRTSSSWWDLIYETIPLDQLPCHFWLYLISGAALYGAVVPFWFFASKYFQESLFVSVEIADLAVAIPEMSVMLLGVPVGWLVKRYQLTVKAKLKIVGLMGLLMAAAFFCFVFAAVLNVRGQEWTTDAETGELTADYETLNFPFVILIFGALFLGVGFSAACSLYWGVINELVEEKYLSPVSSITSAGVNVLPSILPQVFTGFVAEERMTPGDWQPHFIMIILGITSIICAIFALMCASDSLTALVDTTVKKVFRTLRSLICGTAPQSGDYSLVNKSESWTNSEDTKLVEMVSIPKYSAE